MKNVRKLKNTVKAAAGSALLVGATLTGAAGLAAASSHTGGDSGSMDLGDYPHPFVNDDGEVDSTIVVGSQGRQSDVVGAINVAGSLGNSAYTTSEQSVSVEGSFGWSADGGVTLDTQNDQLFFNSYIDDVRQTLTEDQLDVLETQEVLSGDEQQDVEQYLYLGHQQVQFGNPGDADDEDPFLYVENPANPDDVTDEDSYLYRLQANFQDGVEFANDAGDDRNDDVYGEEVSMFGMDFTVADESFNGNNDLVLYGSQQEVDVTNGESSTVTVDGDEYTVETVAVTDSNAAAVRIDGTLEQVEENDEFDIGGETLRIDSIIDTGDNGAGVVQFAIGSEQIMLEDGEPVMTGSDEDEVDGTHVNLEGSNLDSDATSGNDVELSSVEVAVGADDSDDNYVRADEAFEDPVFNDVELHFGGLNPDVASEDAENVGEVEFTTDGDDTATIGFSDGDNDATVGFAYDGGDKTDNQYSDIELADSDGDRIKTVENAVLTEDDYFVSDAGDFSHLWEVTDINVDGTDTVMEIEDAVTGASVELEADSDTTSSNVYVGTEVIDGQEYKFRVDDSGSTPYANVVWGTGSTLNAPSGDYDGNTNTGGGGYSGIPEIGATSVFPAVDTDSGAAVSFYDPDAYSFDGLVSDEEVLEMPSTESTSAKKVRVGDDGSEYFVDIGADQQDVITDASTGEADTIEARVGQVVYDFEFANDGISRVELDENQVVDNGNDDSGSGSIEPDAPAAIVMQPEDDSDNENAFIVQPGVDTDDEEIEVGGGAGSFTYAGAGNHATQPLDSDDDVNVGYTTYGTYAEEDTDEQGSVTLNIPDGQSTAGAAVTGAEGSISASAGASGTVETNTPTGWPDAAQLDENVDTESASNLIMVGGPAVNTLVSDLAEENKTWTADQYEEDTWVLDMVEGFSSDQHALVVAGYGAEDTRAASEFLANYQDNADELAGETRVSMETQ